MHADRVDGKLLALGRGAKEGKRRRTRGGKEEREMISRKNPPSIGNDIGAVRASGDGFAFHWHVKKLNFVRVCLSFSLTVWPLSRRAWLLSAWLLLRKIPTAGPFFSHAMCARYTTRVHFIQFGAGCASPPVCFAVQLSSSPHARACSLPSHPLFVPWSLCSVRSSSSALKKHTPLFC